MHSPQSQLSSRHSPLTLHHLIAIAQLVDLHFVDAVKASMLEIVLNHVERIRAAVPQAHILFARIGHQISAPRVIHAGGQQLLLQQLFAVRLQLGHIDVIAEVSPKNDRIVALKVAQVPVANVQLVVVGGQRGHVGGGVLVEQFVGVKDAIAALPFAAKADFRRGIVAARVLLQKVKRKFWAQKSVFVQTNKRKLVCSEVLTSSYGENRQCLPTKPHRNGIQPHLWRFFIALLRVQLVRLIAEFLPFLLLNPALASVRRALRRRRRNGAVAFGGLFFGGSSCGFFRDRSCFHHGDPQTDTCPAQSDTIQAISRVFPTSLPLYASKYEGISRKHFRLEQRHNNNIARGGGGGDWW